MNKIIYIVSFVLILLSCGKDKNDLSVNKYIVPTDTLALLLADMHTIDAAGKQNYLGNNFLNTVRSSQFKTVLIKYNIPKQRFDSTLQVYAVYPKEFMVVYDSSIAILKRQLKIYSDVKGLPVSAQPGPKPRLPDLPFKP